MGMGSGTISVGMGWGWRCYLWGWGQDGWDRVVSSSPCQSLLQASWKHAHYDTTISMPVHISMETETGSSTYSCQQNGVLVKKSIATSRKHRLNFIPVHSLVVSDVDRVGRFRLTLRFFDDVLTSSWFTFPIPTSNSLTTRRNFQSVVAILFLFSPKSSCYFSSVFYRDQGCSK